MDERSAVFLKQTFKEYYFKNSSKVETPSRMGEREFGYAPFEGGMVRHIAFKARGELVALLVKEAPKGVYYSCAYYYEPSSPMAEKGWKGGDLVFDIDADDLRMPCRGEHDRWSCKRCGHVGVGLRPKACPQCGNPSILELNWVCHRCLGAAKKELLKLMDILIEDLGLQRRDMRVYFSGNMGYHLTLENPRIEVLDQLARSELADYVAGIGLIPEAIGVSKQATYEDLMARLPGEAETGWRGRLAKYFKEYSVEGFDERGRGVKAKIAHIYSKAGYSRFAQIMEEAARSSGAAVDPAVTTDVHRIFRLPGTLHGETGLAKVRVDRLMEFDPFVHAVALEDPPIDVHIEHSPRFNLREKAYGPYKSERVKLPLAAAVYLMGRGLARPP